MERSPELMALQAEIQKMLAPPALSGVELEAQVGESYSRMRALESILQGFQQSQSQGGGGGGFKAPQPPKTDEFQSNVATNPFVQNAKNAGVF